MRSSIFALAAAATFGLVAPAGAQDTCPNRGQLDQSYCDADKDLVADVPADPAKQKDPSTLVFAYTPIEDPAVYQNLMKPFVEYLSQCTGKKTVYFPVQSNSAQIEAMRSGRLHIAAFASGPTGFAVNLAGAVPFAVKGTEKELRGYSLIAVVKASSPYQKLADLKGKKVAHTSPSSNSGNLAPQVLFPAEGLKSGQDYTPIMSGGHDKSMLGVNSGDYDMAAVSSDTFERMSQRGVIKAADFRILYKSPVFPSTSFAHAHDLKPDLAAKVRSCFLAFKFTPEMQKEFTGDDRFLPMTYKETWAVVRKVAEDSGTPYNRTAYETEQKREAAEAAKKKAIPSAADAPAPAKKAP
ncbi:MAG: phosphate/phosphite/phosphonate ABC transporter substrate-binding protein [Hyphomicrobiaceae bacterium]